MKKWKTGLAVAGMILGLTACGGAGDPAQGDWSLTEAYQGETKITQEQLQKQGIGGTVMHFEDGKVTITSSGEETEGVGEYTVKDDTVTITSEGEDTSFSGVIDDDTMTISQDDSKMIFKRD